MRSYFDHLVYLLWHKFYVLRAGLRRDVSLWQLVIHDWTKFTPAEFIPLSRHFFAAPGSAQWHRNESEPTATAFKEAIKLHYRRNPHHWEHWVDAEGQAYRMPLRYVREMLADWEGAGFSKHGWDNSVSYYTEHRERINLHPATRLIVEAELGL